MLVTPASFDQPDNAFRAEHLGVSRTLPRKDYHADSLVRELSLLLEDPGYRQRAEEISKTVGKENGAITACNLVEGMLIKFQQSHESHLLQNKI